jgi:hypothetical protein
LKKKIVDPVTGEQTSLFDATDFHIIQAGEATVNFIIM